MARAGIRCYVNGEHIRTFGDSRNYIKAKFKEITKNDESILKFAGNPTGSSNIKLIRYNKTKTGEKKVQEVFETNIFNQPIELSGGIVYSARVKDVAKELLEIYGIDVHKGSDN